MKRFSCGFIIKNIDGMVLVTHPTNAYSNNEKIWVFPKGMLENDETYLECAYREVKEETNLDLRELNGKISYFDTYKRKKVDVILYLFESDIDLRFYDIKCNYMVYKDNIPIFPENDDFKWVDLNNIDIKLSKYEENMLKNRLL